MIFQLFVAAAVAGLTWLVGWWGVAVVAVILGFTYRGEAGRPWRIALGAGEGWAILLLADALGGRLGVLATTVGGAMRLPAAGLFVVTLLFPALVGWSGATVGALLGHTLSRRTPPAAEHG